MTETPTTRALIAEARAFLDRHEPIVLHGDSHNLMNRLADALEALPPSIGSARAEDDAEALRRYRAATHWIGADSWDGCSDCMARLRWAATYDLNRDMSNDEIAETMRPYFADALTLPPSTGSARAEEWRRLTPDDARTPMLLYAPPEKLHSDPRGMPGELRYAKPCDFTWATLGLEINNPIPDDLKLPAPPSKGAGE